MARTVTAAQVRPFLGQVATIRVETRDGMGNPYVDTLTGTIEAVVADEIETFGFQVLTAPNQGLRVMLEEVTSIVAAEPAVAAKIQARAALAVRHEAESAALEARHEAEIADADAEVAVSRRNIAGCPAAVMAIASGSVRATHRVEYRDRDEILVIAVHEYDRKNGIETCTVCTPVTR